MRQEQENSLALLHLISWRLLPAPCLSLLREDEEVLELGGVRELLAVAESYHSLRPDRQVGGGYSHPILVHQSGFY